MAHDGLKALLLETLPPGKTKESILGFFPVLGSIIKENKPDEPAQLIGTQTTNHINNPPDIQDPNLLDAVSNYDLCRTHIKSTKLLELTQKLDVVIKQITRSAAQRSHFAHTAEKLKKNFAPLIAGYGIQWNIRYQSYQKAMDAHAIINHILKEGQEQKQAGLFADVFFTP
ncbi:hypothetical protein PGT21_028152 [Puccinia graminis f. sp. tritici]|uniref:Uncharacterized protein n=2 Tax=Puccinia graminis f. sp. tritici TaxID=56615 RepID=E3K236_PUCGT|nr:uncharacterized protein PGTG_04361 [Puccinia graminis f. sp. tritici CRL 75-36-700-3]EFP78405.2 hypothetical protein PGTG_04361 [Puccinia graminis f. sp. tritici CRL 75-36-700-3]KAA1119530.1 hypothetical protein PGT21_028152 [Puccinia graminis f. sp. tritici]KAA1120780.1 hypothetical protein PGTUg99_015437 [Puccinia graminis f. sp. tritici]